MAEASMIGVFNTKVSAFNNALKENDIDSVCDIGADMLHIVLDECLKPNVSTTLKEIYRKQGTAVISHLVRFAKKSGCIRANRQRECMYGDK